MIAMPILRMPARSGKRVGEKGSASQLSRIKTRPSRNLVTGYHLVIPDCDGTELLSRCRPCNAQLPFHGLKLAPAFP